MQMTIALFSLVLLIGGPMIVNPFAKSTPAPKGDK